jgi:hypothetical protein
VTPSRVSMKPVVSTANGGNRSIGVRAVYRRASAIISLPRLQRTRTSIGKSAGVLWEHVWRQRNWFPRVATDIPHVTWDLRAGTHGDCGININPDQADVTSRMGRVFAGGSSLPSRCRPATSSSTSARS